MNRNARQSALSNQLNSVELRNAYKTLKCSFCEKYLSVPPIFISHDGEINRCGRCLLVDSSKNLFQNTTYETLAKNMKFPCSESKNCNEVLSWGKISDHENICPFRQFACPQPKCQQKFQLNDVLKHFRRQHKVYTGRKITHTFQGLPSESDIIFIDAEISYFLASFTIIENVLRYNVFTLKTTEGSTYKFSIGFSSINGNVEYNARHNITTYPGEYSIELNTHYIKQKSLEDILEIDNLSYGIDITLQIYDSKQTNSTDPSQANNIPSCCCSKDVLKAIECPLCYDTMNSNIYLCNNGHSICANCKPRVTSCPTCRNSFIVGRNFALETVFEKLKLHSPSCYGANTLSSIFRGYKR